MSICGVSEDENDDVYEVLEWHIKREKDVVCDFCTEPIPAGESLLLTVWGYKDYGAIRELCAWCEDTFKDRDGMIPAYPDRDSFVDAMTDRLSCELSHDEVKAEFAAWMDKPEAYRAEFTRRFGEVVDELLACISQGGVEHGYT
jgi:hypothetical protein